MEALVARFTWKDPRILDVYGGRNWGETAERGRLPQRSELLRTIDHGLFREIMRVGNFFLGNGERDLFEIV